MTTIAAYCICKNEATRIDSLIDTLAEFDEIVVVDTGSTDRSVQLLRNRGITVYEHTFDPFDFSAARLTALSYVSQDIDWCLWIDFNETLPEFSKRAFVDGIDPNATEVILKRYDSSDGKVVEGSQSFPRFHRRHGYSWKHRVHEQLIKVDGQPAVPQIINIPIVKQVTTTPYKTAFYQSLCEQALEAGDDEPAHYLWFLTGYYHDAALWKDAAEACKMYLLNTLPYDNDFRPIVWRRWSRSEFELGNISTAVNLAFAALGETLWFPYERKECLRHIGTIGAHANNTNLVQAAVALMQDPVVNM